MKRIVALLLAVCCLALPAGFLTACMGGTNTQQDAAEVGPASDIEEVHALDIEVVLAHNGDAHITEVWDMTVL